VLNESFLEGSLHGIFGSSEAPHFFGSELDRRGELNGMLFGFVLAVSHFECEGGFIRDWKVTCAHSEKIPVR
jgi:hypothetical protein